MSTHFRTGAGTACRRYRLGPTTVACWSEDIRQVSCRGCLKVHADAAGDDLDTETARLGRHTPRNAGQMGEALQGIAQCDADWAAGELTTSDDMIRLAWTAHERAGYRVRWLELAATLPRAEVPA